jgi:hypothetical protein
MKEEISDIKKIRKISSFTSTQDASIVSGVRFMNRVSVSGVKTTAKSTFNGHLKL